MVDSHRNESQPRSIDHLTELARVPFDPSLAIKSYLRTCDLLYQRAKAYESEDEQLDLAFIYLFRAANTLVQDLPSHPDYDLLPTNSKLRIQTVGTKYLRALASVKAKLTVRSKQFSERQPLSNRPDGHSSSQNASTVNSTLSSPHPNSITRVPQTPSSAKFSPPATVSRSISSSQTPRSSKDLNKSHPSFSFSSRTHNLHSDASRTTISQVPSKQPDSHDSLNDWTILPSSAGIPVLENWHPSGKKQSYRRRSEPVSPSTLLQRERNPFVWPIALGNGQGQPMSTAMPVDQAMKPKHTNYAPRRSASRRDTGPSNSPSIKKPGLLDGLPFSAHVHSTSNLLDRRPNQTSSNRNNFALPGASTRTNPHELYNLCDQTAVSPRQKLTPFELSPHSLDFHSDGQPAYVRLATTNPALLSRDNVPALNQMPKSPEPHSSNPIALSGSKSFIRPRRTSWSYPSSKSKTKLPSSISTSLLGSDRLPNQLPPSSPPIPARTRRASIGESSTWRWLKGLNIRSFDKSPPKLSGSNVPNLYADTFPAENPDKIKNGHLLSRAQAQQLKTNPSPSKSPQTYVARTSPSSNSFNQINRPPTPRRELAIKVPGVIKTPAQSSFQFRSPNHSDSNSERHSHPLRSMRCPKDLVGAFLAMAEPETEKGIELCGLLLGKLHPRNKSLLVIDTLLIPKQISSPDTCHTINEDELFKFQDEMGLMTLGWIHTHPTQTCFLSSLDLHTHLSYQLMLPEAVAIVCSPRKEPSLGVFRLIDPDGIQSILDCKESSSFHPHAIDSKLIYCDADNHFKLIEDPSELNSMKLDIRDLRA